MSDLQRCHFDIKPSANAAEIDWLEKLPLGFSPAMTLLIPVVCTLFGALAPDNTFTDYTQE